MIIIWHDIPMTMWYLNNIESVSIVWSHWGGGDKSCNYRYTLLTNYPWNRENQMSCLSNQREGSLLALSLIWVRIGRQRLVSMTLQHTLIIRPVKSLNDGSTGLVLGGLFNPNIYFVTVWQMDIGTTRVFPPLICSVCSVWRAQGKPSF